MRRVLVVTALLIPAASSEQRPATIRLQPPDARLETGFTAITSIRELSDGRIIVTDPRDQGLVVADFRTGDVQPISRRGGGPGEYGLAAPVHPIAGDSSLLSDFMQRRILLLDKDKPVAVEFVSTSISSGGDGQDLRPGSDRMLANNSQLKFVNDQRGYTVSEVTPEAWKTHFMVLDKVSEAGRPISRRATATVPRGEASLSIA